MPILANAKHERFAREYVIDNNATQAAIRAGYSEKTAGSQGFDLLKKPEIAERIGELTKRTLQQADITAERVMLELARLAFHDGRRLFDENGKPKPIQDLDDDTAACVSSVSVGKGNKVHVRTAGKEAALRMLAQRFKLIGTEADEALNNLAMSFAEKVAAARKRRESEGKA